MNSSTQTRDAYLVEHFLKGGGIVRASIGMVVALAVCSLHAQVSPCGITELPSASIKIYPPIAQAAHVGGTVVLIAVLDRNGTAKVSRVLSGPAMLRDAATTLVETSKTEPSGGSRECQITITFELADTHICDIPPDPPEPFSKTDPQHLTVYGRVAPICDSAATLVKQHHFLFFHWTTKS